MHGGFCPTRTNGIKRHTTRITGQRVTTGIIRPPQILNQRLRAHPAARIPRIICMRLGFLLTWARTHNPQAHTVQSTNVAIFGNGQRRSKSILRGSLRAVHGPTTQRLASSERTYVSPDSESLYIGFRVARVSELISADFDLDGDVDGDDFLLWQVGFGGSQSGHGFGDSDYDGDVDGDDFLNWQTQFGTGGGSASATAPSRRASCCYLQRSSARYSPSGDSNARLPDSTYGIGSCGANAR